MAQILLYCVLLVCVAFCNAKTIRPVQKQPKAGCSLLYSEFPMKEPVFLKPDLSLIEPKVASIDLKTNEEIMIACPGTRNTLIATGNSLEKAKCARNDILKIGTVEYSLSELNCSKALGGEVVETSESCGNKRGVIKTIGHTVDDGTYDYIFHVCYDDKNGEALYAEHIVYGAAIANAKKESSRPSFKSNGLGPGVTADNAYKQATQKSRFTELLGSSALAEKYINTGSYLARGHLSPDGDFVYVSSSFSTYYYINTVPQWQAVNNGNWKSLEFAVRNTAANLNRNLRVITGGHEVLTLEDTKGKPQEMYLVTGNKLPVPKFSWKVVQDVETSKAIAFVTLNNPFLEEVDDGDILCNNICEKTNWGVPAWSTKPSKGITYCCEVKELMKKIKTIPDVKPSGILEAKNKFVFRMLMS